MKHQINLLEEQTLMINLSQTKKKPSRVASFFKLVVLSFVLIFQSFATFSQTSNNADWNIFDYSNFKTGDAYGDEYPYQEKVVKKANFCWNTVPRWIATRNVETYSEDQIEALASADIVMLEKANNAGFDTIEKGISSVAARIKAINPDVITLFYWNTVINYGGYAANAEFEANKEDWAVKNTDGSIFLFKDLYYNYNYNSKGLRDWWVSVPIEMAQDPNIDGVFYDKITGARVTEVFDNNGMPVNNYAKMLQDAYNKMPEGKITLGNTVRNEWTAGNRGLMEVFDGSYLERWTLRNRSSKQTEADAVGVSIQLMREALAKGKIINLNAHPHDNFLDGSRTDQYGETITDELPTDPAKLRQFIEDNIYFPLAVFLISAEEGAYFNYKTGVNALSRSTDYWDTSFVDELNYYLGPPLAEPTRNGYVYTRSFENLNVTVDLETKQTTFDWINKSRAVPNSCITGSNNNEAPTVSFNSPNAGDTLATDTEVLLSVQAEDVDGSIADVRFFVNGKLIKRDASSPFRTPWVPTEFGNLTIEAVAIDNSGATSTTSVSVSASSPANIPPEISFDLLNSADTLTVGTEVLLSAQAQDVDGSVVDVKFYVNGELVRRDASSPFRGPWSPTKSGNLTIEAVATDNLGATSTTEIKKEVVSNSNIVTITKRNAGFSIDGGRKGATGQNVYLWQSNKNNKNQQWVETSYDNGYYSYRKIGTDFCIDGGNGGVKNQTVYLWDCNENNRNQHWQKVAVDGGAFKLIKRNAPGYAINGGSGGANAQDVNLYDSSNSSKNLHWYITIQ